MRCAAYRLCVQIERYGFVIYMFVDGYSRSVLSIKVSAYDGAKLVLNQYAALARENGYKFPALFRTDKGGCGSSFPCFPCPLSSELRSLMPFASPCLPPCLPLGHETPLLMRLALKLGCVPVVRAWRLLLHAHLRWLLRNRTHFSTHTSCCIPLPHPTHHHLRCNFSRGKSTMNQRVERIWGEVNKVTMKYKILFETMERLEMLDIGDPIHISALRSVWMAQIAGDLEKWAKGWNCHPIASNRRFRANRGYVYGKPNVLFLSKPSVAHRWVTRALLCLVCGRVRNCWFLNVIVIGVIGIFSKPRYPADL